MTVNVLQFSCSSVYDAPIAQVFFIETSKEIM